MLTSLLAICLSLIAASYGFKPSSERIIGGNEISITQAPHHVAVHVRQPSNSSSFVYTCGGSIIRSDVVATSALCTVASPDAPFAITAGATNLDEEEFIQFVDVRRVVVHETFSQETMEGNLALLFLAKNLTVDNVRVRPIFLPTENSDISTTLRSTSVGWGLTEEGGENSFNLKQLTMPIVDWDRCREIYSNFRNLTETMFCAGYLGQEPEAGICEGDFGGSLVQSLFLAGIASWSVGCGNPEYPAVFVKVSMYRRWLDEKLLS